MIFVCCCVCKSNEVVDNVRSGGDCAVGDGWDAVGDFIVVGDLLVCSWVAVGGKVVVVKVVVNGSSVVAGCLVIWVLVVTNDLVTFDTVVVVSWISGDI